MAYIGNTVENQGFTPAIDYFNGNGVTVTFTLSRPIASVAQVIVAIDNVIQNPSSSYTVAGSAITFSSAPLSGTNNIWVEYTSLITTYQGISQDPTVIGDIRATGGYLAEGDFGNSFVDGAIFDYVTGLGRITAGSGAGVTLYTGGTSGRVALATFASNGNVGIGTSSPSSLLTVKGEIRREYASNTALYTTVNYDGISVKGAQDAYYLVDSGRFQSWYTGASERMRIDSSGNVGIGTSSPEEKLTLNGTYRTATSQPWMFEINNTATQATGYGGGIAFGGKFNASDITYFANITGAKENSSSGDVAGYLAFFSRGSGAGNTTERMRIDSSGNLYLNTTTQNDSGKFNINFDSTVNIGLGFKQTNGGTTGTIINCFNSSTQTGSITQNATNVQFNTSSDYRLKENIAPMIGALDRVQQLKPVTWAWKLNGDSGQGFIAHELAEVCPDAVHGEKDAVDADGNPKYQGVDTSFLVATLTAAIQEQQAMIEELKTKVAALEAK